MRRLGYYKNINGKLNEESAKHKIIIHVCGGIYHIVENPDDVEIEIVDFDLFDFVKDIETRCQNEKTLQSM